MGIIAWIALGLGPCLLEIVPRGHPERVLQRLHLAHRHRRRRDPAAGLRPGHQPQPVTQMGPPVNEQARRVPPAPGRRLIS